MNALSITDLHKTYAGGTSALKGISFDVEKGDFFALLGPNGAGKSTAIGIISCLVNKTGGTVKIFDKDIDTQSELTKSFVGLVPQEFNFNIFEKVMHIVVNQAGYYGIKRKVATKRAEYLLTKLGLWHKRDAQSQSLSGGMKRKLMIARALVHEPRLLILDEPTAGVDVETRREMWKFMAELNESGTTIILTTHYLEEAEKMCRNVAIIDRGEIVENTSIRRLLSTLESETYILLTAGETGQFKPVEGYELKRLDNFALKLELLKDQNLNDVIRLLNGQGIEIKSVRSKSNKLEELFLNLVNKK